MVGCIPQWNFQLLDHPENISHLPQKTHANDFELLYDGFSNNFKFSMYKLSIYLINSEVSNDIIWYFIKYDLSLWS